MITFVVLLPAVVYIIIVRFLVIMVRIAGVV